MRNTKLILLAALICAPAITRAVTVITSLPYGITASGEYELQNNLTANGTDGIWVAASNVSINLASYTITGNKNIQIQTSKTIGIGVDYNCINVSIQNGTITGFDDGLLFFGSGSEYVVKNLRFLGINDIGVHLVNSSNCLVENCLIVAADGTADKGIILELGCANVLVKDNQISGFSNGFGIVEDAWDAGAGPSALIGNYEANCEIGIKMNLGKYQRNITTNCSEPTSGGTAVGKENG